jgi:RimJ/RimL family protein N-acetyltransferase
MVDLARSLGLPALGAFCHPDHAPSIRVLEKGGFARERSTVMHQFPNLTPAATVELARYVRHL